MSHFREKAEAQTKQIIGQMIGDELLVREAHEQLRHANEEPGEQHGQHRVQTGMPKPHPPHVSRLDRDGDPPGERNSRQ
jgi:hypothetical protein